MCCKTSKNSREVVEKRKEEERKKKEKVNDVFSILDVQRNLWKMCENVFKKIFKGEEEGEQKKLP